MVASNVDGTRFDWHEYDRPSVAIATAVATVTGRDPTELTPIFDVIDPGPLNDLLNGYSPDLEITFVYEGCHIEIRADGTLVVSP